MIQTSINVQTRFEQKCPKRSEDIQEHHWQFDSVLDSYLPLGGKEKKTFQTLITPVQITSVDDLKGEISKKANSSIRLANRCYSENRILTKDEALRQVAMSVSLLRAIINNTNK